MVESLSVWSLVTKKWLFLTEKGQKNRQNEETANEAVIDTVGGSVVILVL